MKTYFCSKEEAQDQRKWVLVDADGQLVGRLATTVASILRGKNKPIYCSHNDCGDFVVIVNAEKVRFTGDKAEKKLYYRHTGHVGGIKSRKAADVLAEKPEDVIRHAVKGMLPKTSLGRAQLSKLKVYSGMQHPHAAQQPQPLEL